MNVECGNEVDDTDSSHMIRDKKKKDNQLTVKRSMSGVNVERWCGVWEWSG